MALALLPLAADDGAGLGRDLAGAVAAVVVVDVDVAPGSAARKPATVARSPLPHCSKEAARRCVATRLCSSANPLRHPRESGGPASSLAQLNEKRDSRFRGNDDYFFGGAFFGAAFFAAGLASAFAAGALAARCVLHRLRRLCRLGFARDSLADAFSTGPLAGSSATALSSSLALAFTSEQPSSPWACSAWSWPQPGPWTCPSSDFRSRPRAPRGSPCGR